jgi:2-oxoisovalerate dehydrogenase E2 component (dihydrolipoyl transacylase)
VADSAYKRPYVSDAIRRTGIKPGERRQIEAAIRRSRPGPSSPFAQYCRRITAQAKTRPFPRGGPGDDELRRKIAERMQDAKTRIPHFAYVEEFDMTALEELRASLNEQRDDTQAKLTLLPFFMRAIVQLRESFPDINARFDDRENVLHSYEEVHIGVATQTDGGLTVPVVRNAEARDIWDCAAELARVSAAARDGSAERTELTGSTITVTSLGKLGGIAATPVINSPEVAIVGPNKLVQRPVVQDGEIVVRTVMNVSSSFDHRIIDGYVAASFVQELKALLEDPEQLTS